jgi:hypothetical protein
MPTYKGDFDDFNKWAADKFPPTVRALQKVLLFKIATDVYGVLVSMTPVDTGYLRLSLSARLNGAGGFEAPDPTGIKRVKMFWAPSWAASTGASMGAIGKFAAGDKLEIGYTANYARFVEARRHMVKTAFVSVPSIILRAKAAVMKGGG